MLRKNLASSRLVRVGVFGLATFAAAATTNDGAQARRYSGRHHAHHVRHHESEESYSPQFSSIVVDGNSGATLAANSPDGVRHPASLTKIMTLYLLFERLDEGKMKLDTDMPVSAHAAEQDPTKLDLRPGQTIKVEDAIKGLVTRSANDAAVVIAEAIGGSEDEFAKMMTRKARALGMSRTTYRNASGLPNDEQVTTARDQATLGRAIQGRFPRYYRYFSTQTFNFRGHSISNHNHLLGNVEGVDGIKTGYTRASGFNLVTSMHRGNRFLIGVVMGGRSSGSRDATMRSLLAENLGKAATHTIAAITERNTEATTNIADAEPRAKAVPAPVAPAGVTPASPDGWQPPAMRAPAGSKVTAAIAEATAAVPAPQARSEPAPLSSGAIHIQQIAATAGSSEPMKPVKVKTVQVKAGSMKLASAAPSQPAPPVANALQQSQPALPETSNAVVAKAAEIVKPEPVKSEPARAELLPQPPGHGTGNGLLGVLPASSFAAAPAPQLPAAIAAPQTPPVAPAALAAPIVVATAQPTPPPAPVQPQTTQQNGAVKPVVHPGWIVQVGALETEDEAQQRIQAAKSSAHGLLSRADSFTEPVIAKDNRRLFRARFAGLERDQAEAVCRTLRRSDIPCITAHN
jgi:D-alanyl-D-alanine carboxypeptidase